MEVKNISDIQKYTVAIYREINSELKQNGSGVLFVFKGNHYLISAYHVLDLEEEQIQIQNDPDERDIPHDDLDSFYAKGKNEFFHINEDTKGVVFTAYLNEETGTPNFNEDTEFCYCTLSEEMVRRFMEIGKKFYSIKTKLHYETGEIKKIIVSGYPKYALKNDQEEYRSYLSERIINDNSFHDDLIRVSFENDKAYNNERNQNVKLPPYGIQGMSGGGIWGKKNDEYIPIGIIIKQAPVERYIEGYRIDQIFKKIISDT